jgi:formylglycine-generating enzyme required for sulfatase activity
MFKKIPGGVLWRKTPQKIEEFFLKEYPVTVKEYRLYCLDYGRELPKTPWKEDEMPVTNVTWHDAVSYCDWASTSAYEVRLPTAVEWEYAAGTQCFKRGQAVCDGCGSKYDNLQPPPVRQFEPNEWGLYDMLGGVWEWTLDCPEDPRRDCTKAITKGGSWYDLPSFIDAKYHEVFGKQEQDCRIGFRTVLTERILI